MHQGRLLVAQGADDEAVSAANAALTIITGYFPRLLGWNACDATP
jgi:hypothetical protein